MPVYELNGEVGYLENQENPIEESFLEIFEAIPEELEDKDANMR